MSRWIYNNTGLDKTYNGASYPASAYTEILDTLMYKTSQNEDVIADIMSGDINISIDGTTKIDDKNLQINQLKGFKEDRDESGRLISRTAATIKGWHYQALFFSLLFLCLHPARVFIGQPLAY